MRLAIFMLLTACAPRLKAGFEIEGGDFTDSSVYSSTDEAGVVTTQVQATDKEAWIYFDFETDKETSAEDPTWDLAFQRFKIRMNAGAAAAASTTEFDALEVPPDVAYEEDPSTGDSLFFTRGEGWYYYDLGTHTLTSRRHTYVVRSVEGAVHKLELLAYYDSFGSSGYPAFRWQTLAE
jgi:HmuY protein